MKLHRLFYALVLLSAFGVGRVASQAELTAAAPSCKTYSPPSLPAPSVGPILSSIQVPDAFQLGSVVVKTLSLAAPRVGALKITLSAGTGADGEPKSVILKDVRSGAEAAALTDTTFDDDAAVPFPDTAASAPFTATYMPGQMLYTFTLGDDNSTTAGTGGSQGTWVLRVVDLKDASHVITLTSWELELCAESPATPSTAPAVAAAAGPAEPTSTTPAAASDRAAAPPTENGSDEPSDSNADSKTSTAQYGGDGSAADQGLLVDLLDRLNALSPLGRSNRTTLRQTLGNDTLLERLNNRLEDLMAPFNETRLARGISAMQNISEGATGREPGVVDRFLTSFRDLVNLAGGSNATRALDGSQLRSAMAQSGISLGMGDAGVISGLMGRINDGSLLGQFNANNGIIGGLGQVLNTITAGPVAGAARTQLQQALQTVATGLGIKTTFAKETAQDALNFLRGSKGLIADSVAQHVNNYRDLVQSCGNLIQLIVKRQADQSTQAAIALQTAVQGVLSSLGQVKQGPVRERLQGLLTRQLGNLGNLRSSTPAFGDDVSKVSNAFVGAYTAQMDALRGVLSTSLNAKLGRAQTAADTSIGVFNGVLNRISDALDQATNFTGPLADKGIAKYTQGLRWLEGHLDGLRSTIDATPDVALDGSLIKGVAGGITTPLLARMQQSADEASGADKVDLAAAMARFKASLQGALAASGN